MYWVNKIVWALINPMTIIWVMIVAGVVGSRSRTMQVKRFGKIVFWMGLVAMWIWMTPLMTRILGVPLESEWLVDGKVPTVESFPQADAIVLLGGGMGGSTNLSAYAEMTASADRVWQAARLYKAGKAPKIIVTGDGNEFTTKWLLMDFGVPTNALVFVDVRNTEEESQKISLLFHCPPPPFTSTSSRPKVLLVTSAWHMKRAKLMFEKFAPSLEIVPAATDFEATITAESNRYNVLCYFPSSITLLANGTYLHEWIGYYWYKWFR